MSNAEYKYNTIGGGNMAKKELNTMRVESKEFGNYTYQAFGMPKVTNGGHSALVAIPSLLYSVLQSKGKAVYDTQSCVEYVKGLIEKDIGQDIPDSWIGTRGPDWKLPEQRAEFRVFVGDTEFSPAINPNYVEKRDAKLESQKAKLLTAKDVETPKTVATPQEISVPTPKIVAKPTVEIPTTPAIPTVEVPQAIADTTESEQVGSVDAVLKAIENGSKHKLIQSALNKKYGETRGVELWNSAVAELNKKAAPVEIQTPQLPKV